jgi:hypothetical protein
MKLGEIVQNAFTTGQLSVNLEQQIQSLLKEREFNDAEIAAIDLLIEALYRGLIESVPD